MSGSFESKLVLSKDKSFLKEAIFEAEQRQVRFSSRSLTSHSKDV